MPKIPRSSVYRPWPTWLFIEPDAQAAALLPQIAFTRWIHYMPMFTTCVNYGCNLWNFFSYNILVLHWQKWEVNSGHSSNFTRPKTRSIHNMFGMNAAFVSYNIPSSIWTLIGLEDLTMCLDRGPPHARCLGVGMSCARGIEMAVQGIIKRTNYSI